MISKSFPKILMIACLSSKLVSGIALRNTGSSVQRIPGLLGQSRASFLYTPVFGVLSSSLLRRTVHAASDTSSVGACASDMTSSVPPSVQDTVNAVLQMYRTRDVREQASVVEKHYGPDAHFVDPLMNCKGPQEILLAFFSLIKLFDTVKIEQKSAAFATSPRLPSHLDAAQIQQVVVSNAQTYTFARTGALSKRVLPEAINLDSVIYLTLDPKDGKVLWHEDTWPGKPGLPSFIKRPNGIFSFGIFRVLGWGKEATVAPSSS